MGYADMIRNDANSTDIREYLVSGKQTAITIRIPDTLRDAAKEAADHPELERLTEKSRKQLETRAFGMLRECRLIDGDYNITPLYPSARFLALVRETAPQDLDVFPKAGALL